MGVQSYVKRFCVHCISRSLIFGPILMRLGHDIYLDEISNKFEIGSCGFKNSVTWSNLRKTCVHSRGHIFGPVLMKLGQNVCLDDISDKLKMGHVGSKAMSLGHIFKRSCVCSRGHIFGLLVMKLG